MKTEADYNHGQFVIFYNETRSRSYSGTVDYSEGSEIQGSVRIRMIFTETSDEGNTYHIPVNQIHNHTTGE